MNLEWYFDEKIPRTYFPFPGSENIVNKLVYLQHEKFPHLQEAHALPREKFQELYFHEMKQDYLYSYFRMQDDDGRDYYCLACRSPLVHVVEMHDIHLSYNQDELKGGTGAPFNP